MSANASYIPSVQTTVSRHRALVATVLAGVFMILLARFGLDGTLAGMFGVWGISLIAVGIGGHLFLRLWSAYN